MAFIRSELALMAHNGVAGGGNNLWFYRNSAGDNLVVPNNVLTAVYDEIRHGDLLYDVQNKRWVSLERNTTARQINGTPIFDAT